MQSNRISKYFTLLQNTLLINLNIKYAQSISEEIINFSYNKQVNYLTKFAKNNAFY